jgi:hypothetical protein
VFCSGKCLHNSLVFLYDWAIYIHYCFQELFTFLSIKTKQCSQRQHTKNYVNIAKNLHQKLIIVILTYNTCDKLHTENSWHFWLTEASIHLYKKMITTGFRMWFTETKQTASTNLRVTSLGTKDVLLSYNRMQSTAVTGLLTYLLTPYSTVLLEKLTSLCS